MEPASWGGGALQTHREKHQQPPTGMEVHSDRAASQASLSATVLKEKAYERFPTQCEEHAQRRQVRRRDAEGQPLLCTTRKYFQRATIQRHLWTLVHLRAGRGEHPTQQGTKKQFCHQHNGERAPELCLLSLASMNRTLGFLGWVPLRIPVTVALEMVPLSIFFCGKGGERRG